MPVCGDHMALIPPVAVCMDMMIELTQYQCVSCATSAVRLVFEDLLLSDQFHVGHVVLLGPLVQSLQSVKLGLVSGDDQLANLLVGNFMAITVLVGGMQA